MPVGSIVSGLLGGFVDETSKIRQERFQQEELNLKLSMDMLQHIIDNPNIVDPSIKANAQQAMQDILFEHLQPGKYKGEKGNPVRKMVEQFIGQQDKSAQMAGILQNMNKPSQEGVGRGNAKTQVGATQGPPPPPSLLSQVQAGDVPPINRNPPPGNYQLPETPFNPGLPAVAAPGGPPAAPFSAIQPPGIPQITAPSIPTVGGFANPVDVETAKANQQLQIKAAEGQITQQQQFQKAKILNDQLEAMGIPTDQRAQAIAGMMGGNFTTRAPQFVDAFDSRTGQTRTVPVTMENGRLTYHWDQATTKTPAEKIQEVQMMASLLKDDPRYAGMTPNEIAGDLYKRKYEADLLSSETENALRSAEAAYYSRQAAQKDPYEQQIAKMAFDAINNAQAIAKDRFDQASKQAFHFDNGQFVPGPPPGIDYKQFLGQAMQESAESIGWTVEQLQQFAKTGKMPDFSSKPTSAPLPGAARPTNKGSGKWLDDFLKEHSAAPATNGGWKVRVIK